MSDIMLLEIKGIKGGSHLEGAKDLIECLSFSHSVSMPTTNDISNGERTTGKAEHGDLVVTKYVDHATPLLNEKLCAGKPIGQVKFKIGRTDDNQFLPLMDYVLGRCGDFQFVGGRRGRKTQRNACLELFENSMDVHRSKGRGRKGRGCGRQA
jgi:type VI secretion system secreted protein Hcp